MEILEQKNVMIEIKNSFGCRGRVVMAEERDN
jgi:hypothetical protein